MHYYFCAVVTLLCEIILVHALECSQNSSFMPENGVPISERLPTTAQAIFPTLQFECQAIITGGSIQAVGDLNMDLQIWRPQESTGTFYNLVSRRRFRIRSGGGRDVRINASFTSSLGIPVRAGDVIGFHSLVSPRLLFDLSQEHEIYYVEAGQGPLCNFSLNGTSVKQKALPLPSISLTYVNATDKEIQLAELSLPSIDNTCTPVSFIVDNNVMTTTRSTLTVSSTQPTLRVTSGSSSSQGLHTTTVDPSSSDSESISGPNTTQGVSDDDGFFLALSFTEFILVVVILAVVLVSICVVVTIALCCCMFMQHMAHCTGKDEPQISMNTNPVYDTIRTNAGQRPCLGSQLPPCTSNQQPTLIALVPPCNQTLLQDSTEAGYIKPLSEIPLTVVSSTESLNSILTPCQQQNVIRTSSTEDYTYPNLRMHLQEHHNQRTSDGYVIVQPDHSVRESTHENECTDTENCGPRGAMDDTL